MASCANFTEDAIGMLNGTPLCGRHLHEVHEEWIRQDNAQQERVMVALALNFWNSEGRFDPPEWGGLDRHNWQRLMEALAMARGKRVLIFDPPQP
jgi:hypothetical protein